MKYIFNLFIFNGAIELEACESFLFYETNEYINGINQFVSRDQGMKQFSLLFDINDDEV